MTIFYVVSSDYTGSAPAGTTLLKVTDPLVGTDNISVTSGNTYILSSDLDTDLNINQPLTGYDSGNPATLQIEGGNATGYTVEATASGKMNIVVPDNNDASMVDIDGYTGSLLDAGLNISVGDGASLGNIEGAGGQADSITLGQNATVGDINTLGGGDDTISAGTGATIGSVTTGGGADSITLDGASVTGDLNSGSSDVSADTVVLTNGASVGGDIDVGSGSNSVTVENGSTVTGDLKGGAGADTFVVQDATVSGNILTSGGDDNLTLNNATVGGYVNQAGGDDSLTLAGTVNIQGTYSSPTGITFVDASIDQSVGDDTISIESGAVVNAAGVVNQGASPAIGLNEDTLLFTDQADIDTYTGVLGQAGFWDEDGDGTYTAQYNDDLGDKPLGSATGSEGEFSYTGTAFLNIDNTNAGWTCFTRGTLIETDRGAVAVEDLAVGDLVMTRDNGLQPIRWIGSKALSANALAGNEKLRPIRIRRHALGANIPAADLLVSPQHRVLVRSAIARRMFGADEVLVAAKQLCQIEGIDIAHDASGVEYFHILFDRHEIVISNGAETESLYTGPEALKSVGPQALEEIFTLFPELRERDYTPVPARQLATGRMGRKLAVRHRQNNKALVR